MRGEIVARYVQQAAADNIRQTATAVLMLFIVAGMAVCWYRLCYQDGGAELRLMFGIAPHVEGGSGDGIGSMFGGIFGGSSGGDGGGDGLPVRVQDVRVASAKDARAASARYAQSRGSGGAAAVGRSSGAPVAAAGAGPGGKAKDLSKCSTDELKAQLDKLRARKE